MLNSRVASVSDGVVTVVNKANEVKEITFGACVWATGIAMNPLIKAIQPMLPGQNHFRCDGGKLGKLASGEHNCELAWLSMAERTAPSAKIC